jgi:hypothetical protein
LYSVEKPKMTRIRPAVWICSGYWLELAMMGRRTTRRKYFVSVSLDEYVPENHLLRAADHFKCFPLMLTVKEASRVLVLMNGADCGPRDFTPL